MTMPNTIAMMMKSEKTKKIAKKERKNVHYFKNTKFKPLVKLKLNCSKIIKWTETKNSISMFSLNF